MVLDARDIEIPVDSYVRYGDTGTIGKVLDVKTQDGFGWVLIDKTELWYRSNLVELLDKKDIKKSDFYDRENDDEVDVDELKEKAMKFEDMELSSHVAEGGG
ncbi:DUF2098 domain-containing protein [Methanobrevibacter sp.]|uniref:DUF2098 domain-containing protein n=1 Tax=Methanobrevibacter sp. TaxID=66852 RepID=UPI002706F87E|nr:DUF2098 family protein [Methanobrevibacter sp.]